MERYEAHFTLAEYRALTGERDRLKAEKDEAQRQEHMAKAGERQALGQLQRAVEALEAIRDELGVPNENYPAPVANARKIAHDYLSQGGR